MNMFPILMLGTMNAEQRKRATPSMLMNAIPVASAQRGAIAAVTVSTEVRTGIQRERRVAKEVVTAVKSAIDDPASLTTQRLREIPALRAIAADAIRDDILTVSTKVDQVVKDRTGNAEQETATGMIEAFKIAFTDGPALTIDELKKIPALAAIATDELLQKILDIRAPVKQAHSALADEGAQAVEMVIKSKGALLTKAEAGTIPNFIKSLSDAQRAVIVQ